MRIFLPLLIVLCNGCGPTYDHAPPEVARKTIALRALSTSGSSASSDPKNIPQSALKTCDDEDHQVFYKKQSFSNKWGSCARDTWGDKQQTTNCLRISFPTLSVECGSCFGAFAACGAAHCKGACWWNSMSEGCKLCGWRHCGTALERCTEYERSELAEYLY